MISCTSVSLPYISLAHTWSDEEMRDLITEYIAPLLEDRSVICISSKILSIVEGRYMRVQDSSHKERVAHSLSSHSWRCHASHPLMCVTPSGVFAYAGIDESNVNPGYMVLPLTDPMLSASRWRRYIQEISGYDAIAVIITDSASQPLRLGTVSRAVGWAGIRALQDYRGASDLCHQPMQHTQLNRVDALAGMAGLLMGEGDEGRPIVIIEGCDQEVFCDEAARLDEVIGVIGDDIFLETQPG